MKYIKYAGVGVIIVIQLILGIIGVVFNGLLTLVDRLYHWLSDNAR